MRLGAQYRADAGHPRRDRAPRPGRHHGRHPELQERRDDRLRRPRGAGRPRPVLPGPPTRSSSTRTPARPTAPAASSSRPSRPTTSSRSSSSGPTNKLERVSLTYPEIDGVGGKGAALRTIFEIAAALEVQALVVVDCDLRSIVPGVDRAPRRPDPQGRLRLRRPALRPLQVRRHDHEHRHLPADPGALRPPDPPADRRRLRRLGRPRPALPRARRLDAGHQPVRHRHLDDDLGADRRVRGLPDAARGEGPRPEGPRLRPRADVPPGRRDDPAARGDRTRSTGCRSTAATTSRPTASSGSSTRRRSR